VLVVAVPLGIEIQLHIAGCGSVDPTDPANYSTVRITNDTTSGVVVDRCQGTYCYHDLPRPVAPGSSITVDAACDASGSQMTSWRVTRQDGKTLGFIAVDTPRKHDGLVYDVSHATPARDQPTRPAPMHR
jgi:hypothetical protein